MSYYPIVTFLSAATFNLFNYIYQSNEMRQIINEQQKSSKFIDICLFLCQLILLLIFLGLFISACALQKKFNITSDIFAPIISALYIVMAVVYPITSAYFYSKLKQISGIKAKMMKTRIILSAVMISIPFFIRGLYNILKIIIRFDITFADASLKNNDFRYPLFMI
jgi:uncharacterized membrane protein YiaA